MDNSDSNIYEHIQFNEWCVQMTDMTPSQLIDHVSELITAGDDLNIWGLLELDEIDFDVRQMFLTMLGRMVANDEVTTYEMQLLYTITEMALNAIRLTTLLESDWLADHDDVERQLAATTVSIAIKAEDKKLQACIDNGGPADLSPVLFYQYYTENGSTKTNIIDLSNDKETDNDEEIYTRLKQKLNENFVLYGKPGLLAIVADSFIREASIDDPELTSKAASIKDDFITVADTDVREAIAIMVMEPSESEKVCFIHCAYGYDDYGMPQFDSNGRSIQMSDRVHLGKDPSHRGKMGCILYDFSLGIKGF